MSELTKQILYWIEEKNGFETLYFDMKGRDSYTDEIIICSAENKIHSKAIANYIIRCSKKKDINIFSREGLNIGSWILIDFMEVVLHIFIPKTRKYYDIESLYKKINVGESYAQKSD